ncbi:mitochondrial fission factor homolog B isoform X4 [Latimeria chalumnae]|nr:PREDICTED: mitochondrial fission factor isoform X2 [Latimeria chalumnae]|eukprot:XP_005993095.1 PREDICTED: mitochondrial fission factor isoform X2 [Latimeria chalumnae]
MNGAAFPSPTADMAEVNRIHYEIEYTEGINQRMRVPDKLKVAPGNADTEQRGQGEFHHPSVLMQVPERIVVAGDSDDSLTTRPRDLDLIQSTPMETLALKTPPRVLTLSDRPLDFLDLERHASQTPQSEEARSHGRVRRERSMSENAVRQNGQLVRNDSIVTASTQQARVCPPLMLPEDGPNLYSARGIMSLIQSSTRRVYQQVLDVLDENRRYGLSNLDSTFEGTPDDMTVVDATALRRQIIKLNRRLQLLEEENKERAKREMIMYSITVAFWLINSWLWFRR